jgi:hypothetical protein
VTYFKLREVGDMLIELNLLRPLFDITCHIWRNRLIWLCAVYIRIGPHLFPFRTQKLSRFRPMVLRLRESRLAPPFMKSLWDIFQRLFSCALSKTAWQLATGEDNGNGLLSVLWICV